MDYIKEIKKLVECFRDLGFKAEYYFFKPTSKHCIKIEHDTLIEPLLKISRYEPESLFESILNYTSGVKYYKCNSWKSTPEVVFEFPKYSSASELKMKIELRGK